LYSKEICAEDNIEGTIAAWERYPFRYEDVGASLRPVSYPHPRCQ